MTAAHSRTALRLDTPEALRALTGSTYPLSDQQFAAVTAPLAPQVIIAGAGSGKTTVMAARVVWLVATGLVTVAMERLRSATELLNWVRQTSVDPIGVPQLGNATEHAEV